MLYSDILLVLIVVLELERVLCNASSRQPSLPLRPKVEPQKFLELFWTVNWKILVKFLHISSFNWILVLWFRVPTLVTRFTNNFKQFIRLCKLGDIFQDVYRPWNRLSRNCTVNSSSYTSQGTWREICCLVCFHLGRSPFSSAGLTEWRSQLIFRFYSHLNFFKPQEVCFFGVYYTGISL